MQDFVSNYQSLSLQKQKYCDQNGNVRIQRLSMNQESSRYATFIERGWPLSSPIKPGELAAAGFYYTGDSDKVACFSCKQCLHHWEEGDIAWQEHRKINPNCPFVNGKDQRNVPLTACAKHSVDSAKSNGSQPDFLQPKKLAIPDTGRLISPLELITRNGPTYDVLKTCKHRLYATEERRMESFDNWPGGEHPKPSLLAGAGFFYSGTGDKVTCFYCDGCLQGWQPADEPWVEHARNFPRCEWMFQQKGPYFIDYVRGT